MINVGLIGYGGYGKKYYKNLRQNKNFKIIKILRKSKKNLNNLFTNSKKIFFNIEIIDLYIIASPTNTHFEYLKCAIDKQKNIIIEKPIVGELQEYLDIKNTIKKYKKIILINHTDLYMDAYRNLKLYFDKIGKINFVKLYFGKKDHYFIKNIINNYDLPHFEWLPHPLAIIIDLFKDQNYKLNILEKRKTNQKKFLQNLKVIMKGKNANIEINFSNDYKKSRRDIMISGSKSSIIYKGYNKRKLYLKENNKSLFIKSEDTDPIKNLLNSFIIQYKKKKNYDDDKKIILSSSKYLFRITKNLKI